MANRPQILGLSFDPLLTCQFGIGKPFIFDLKVIKNCRSERKKDGSTDLDLRLRWLSNIPRNGGCNGDETMDRKQQKYQLNKEKLHSLEINSQRPLKMGLLPQK